MTRSKLISLFTQDEPAIIKRKIDLQYKVFGKKRSEDSTMKAGALTVSAVFQPMESVAKSGENGWVCKPLHHYQRVSSEASFPGWGKLNIANEMEISTVYFDVNEVITKKPWRLIEH